MKRTQSKAVKPARTGAVKVPNGWLELRKGDPRPEGYKFALVGVNMWHRGDPDLYGQIIDEEDATVMHFIRRNPRAARANKGRKV